MNLNLKLFTAISILTANSIGFLAEAKSPLQRSKTQPNVYQFIVKNIEPNKLDKHSNNYVAKLDVKNSFGDVRLSHLRVGIDKDALRVVKPGSQGFARIDYFELWKFLDHPSNPPSNPPSPPSSQGYGLGLWLWVSVANAPTGPGPGESPGTPVDPNPDPDPSPDPDPDPSPDPDPDPGEPPSLPPGGAPGGPGGSIHELCGNDPDCLHESMAVEMCEGTSDEDGCMEAFSDVYSTLDGSGTPSDPEDGGYTGGAIGGEENED